MSLNYFLARSVVLLILSLQIHLSLQFNCSNYLDKGSDIPSVLFYDAAEATPNYKNNGTVILQDPIDDEGVGWVGLECSHNKAIRWVYNLNFVHLSDTYTLIKRETEDFYSTDKYKFKADIEVKILTAKQKFVFACVTFDNPCERSFIESFYDEKLQRYILKSVPKSEENSTLVRELEAAMIRTTKNMGQLHDDDNSCPVTLSFVDEGELSFKHLFTPDFGDRFPPRWMPDRQTLENAYLYEDLLEQDCVTNECKRIDNTACLTTPKTNDTKFRPVVLYTSHGQNVSKVVHLYHTLVSRTTDGLQQPGKLKFIWEYSDPQDFLVMGKLPSRIYKGQPITIRCYISPFLFSFGTLFGYSSNMSNKITFIPDVLEEEKIEATRIASASITFPLSFMSSKITVFCFSPVCNSSTEWVNVSKQFELIEPKKPSVIGSGKQLYELPLQKPFNTQCMASGIPLPELKIILPANTSRVDVSHNNTSDNVVQTNITIESVDESHAGSYNCVAKNFGGISYYEFKIKIVNLSISERSMSTLTIVLISIFASISAIFLAVVLILFVRFRMEKEELRREFRLAVREFFEGIDAGQVGDDQHLYANDGVKALPYDKKYEVPHNKWNISNTILGAGAFGMVKKGEVLIGNRKSVVAVKTVKSAEDIDEFRATLLELKIMSSIGHHRHIVKLIAASTDEIHNRKVYIGVEYCSNGNLQSYLQKRKKLRLFTNLVKEGRIQFHTTDDAYANVQEGGYENLVETSADISTIDLYKWSFQIASGMDFLESKQVLHADLAARNVLLTEDKLVKISDFGLSRELFENSEYTKKTQVLLPFKWMALESLKWLKFSTKSDVWSYGVTLYEIFTLGEEPYPGQTWSEEFVAALENGMRLDRPPFCTENVYTQVMVHCWQPEPNDRIRFADAMAFFEKAITLLTASPRKNDECGDSC